jgi:DNA-binding transcriptional LysR family regulator
MKTKKKVTQVTLQEVHALESVARLGTLSRAGEELGRGHTGILYSIDQLESTTGLTLLDRTGYRVILTPEGERFLASARRLLEAEQGLAHVIDELKQGWESSLRIVADGIVPMKPLVSAIVKVQSLGSTSSVSFFSAFLGGVEKAFEENHADFMVSVLPPERLSLESVKLAGISATLVASSDHPLIGKKQSREALQSHALVSVRGGDPRLNLPTAVVEAGRGRFQVNDFASKKEVLKAGLGYGWMPNELIRDELRKKELKQVLWEGASTHTFQPRLYFRSKEALGRSGRAFRDACLR